MMSKSINSSLALIESLKATPLKKADPLSTPMDEHIFEAACREQPNNHKE